MDEMMRFSSGRQFTVSKSKFSLLRTFHSFTEPSPDLLLDLDQQLPIGGLAVHVHQADEPVPLLQPVETDARPCYELGREADDALFVFDFESVEAEIESLVWLVALVV